MIKRLAITGLVTGLFATAAFAQAAPPTGTPGAPAAPAQTAPAQAAPAQSEPGKAGTLENADTCLKAATDLAQTVEEKKLADDKLDKIDDLLTKMESHCDQRQFVEAMAVAKDIKTMIEQ